MSEQTFHLQVQIYYEDTDHSGVVYHANYLKFFERAREHALGKEELLRLWHEEKMGFAVYKVEMTFSEGAEFGDILDIRSTYELEGKYRMNWFQEAWRSGGKKAAVKGMVQLVCIDRAGHLLPIPVTSFPTSKKDNQ